MANMRKWSCASAVAILCGVSLFAALNSDAAAQGWKELIRNDSLIWKVESSHIGDLNGDGLTDVVAVLSRDLGKAEVRKGSLWIFFGQGGGGFRLHTRSDGAICFECGGAKSRPDFPVGEPAIKPDGVLWIRYHGGSRYTWDITTKWRLDRTTGQFKLIGETAVYSDTAQRNGRVAQGEVSGEDVNFSTMTGIRTIEGQGTYRCAVNPKFSFVALSGYDFTNSGAVGDKLLSDSCKRVQ